MASDYRHIRAYNEREYGAGIVRWGRDLLAIRYDDRTHFIFELLQNAEDALSRRTGWQGSRTVTFELAGRALRITHYGNPFDERDVRGICGIAESTKDLTAIGRFGIGFKSVYTFTDRPEVHSGAEDFAIENFVWPIAAPRISRLDDETVILIPFKRTADSGHEEIAAGLGQLGASTLLFLRQIEEIYWSVEGGRSGHYLRESKGIDAQVRHVTVIGQEQGETEVDEAWLVFSRPVTANGGGHCGYVEIAFSIAQDQKSKAEEIQRVECSPLVVYFPTVLETHLGFLVQGPYRTTPSRDNVPRNDPWNRNLVDETTLLLVDALRWLRDHDLLDTTATRCLPLDPTKFGEATMFAPLFKATKQALSSEPLLPRFDKGHVPGLCARLARSQDLRELISPSQLGALFGHNGELIWLNSDITQDRTPELRQYLIHELHIAEITPEAFVPRLSKAFLETQSDDWMLELYEFLGGQRALQREGRLNDLALVRLHDGTHVRPQTNGQPQAFLPGAVETGFPTVRRAVCATTEARKFLESLGLTEPDSVDDVIRNVLPKYRTDGVDVSDTEYEADVQRILAAFATDSKTQRENLLAALRDTAFVMAVDADGGSKGISKPGDLYLATERLKDLFSGVRDVLLMDDGYDCLRGEHVRELLEACGATRYLRPIPVAPAFTSEQLRDMRIAAGCESISSTESVEDQTLHGLDDVLRQLPTLGTEPRAKRAGLLWEALSDLEDRRGTGIFSGSYRWYYYHRRSRTFDAAFVRQLKETAWVPGANGVLERPEFVVFEGWKPDPFLQSKIRFKPPVIEALAREAGIEPGLLDLLKKLNVTTVAEFQSKIGMLEPEPAKDLLSPTSVDDAVKNILGGAPEPTPPMPDPSDAETTVAGGESGVRGGGRPGGSGGDGKAPPGPRGSAETTAYPGSGGAGSGKRSPVRTGGRPFISYVATHADDEELGPDGLDQTARMALEEQAIAIILAAEPELQRTPAYTPGFDLVELGVGGQLSRWCEVKAMTGSLRDRPVGLSRAQFEHAQQHGEAYWLYIVEHAGTDCARVVRIQDPAGKARTFTFDHGWLAVAEVDGDPEYEEG